MVIRNVKIPGGDSWVLRDVHVEGGLFTGVSDPASRAKERAERICIPALVDPHVHVREPGFAHKEDWKTCTKAALRGGYTAIMDMPNNREPVTSLETVERKSTIAAKKSYIDFGIYAALVEDNADELKRKSMQELICGIKVYLSETTGGILLSGSSSDRLLMEIFGQPLPVLVHTGGPENTERVLETYRLVSGRYACLPVLYICHVSTAGEVDLVRKYKGGGGTIRAEATPHHLLLNRETYEGYSGVLPPLGKRWDSEALWEGLRDGTVDLIGTDHAPHTVEEKRNDNPPAGFPGLETALVVLLDEAERRGISPERLVEATSTEASRIFKIPGRGRIAAGEPADCVVLERGDYSIGDGGYTTKCGWSPFHGTRVSWKVAFTLRRGDCAYRNGRFRKYPVSRICGGERRIP